MLALSGLEADGSPASDPRLRCRGHVPLGSDKRGGIPIAPESKANSRFTTIPVAVGVRLRAAPSHRMIVGSSGLIHPFSLKPAIRP